MATPMAGADIVPAGLLAWLARPVRHNSAPLPSPDPANDNQFVPLPPRGAPRHQGSFLTLFELRGPDLERATEWIILDS